MWIKRGIWTIAIFVFLVVLGSSIVRGGDIYYQHTTHDVDFNMDAYNWSAMTFYVLEAITVDEIDVYFKKQGAPGGFKVWIYENAGGVPSYPLIYYGSRLGSDVNDTNYLWFNMSIGNETNLTTGKNYSVVIEAQRPFDGSNRLKWGADSAQGYVNGTIYGATDNSTWTWLAYDANFRIYATPTPPVSGSTINLSTPEPANNSEFNSHGTINLNVTGNFSYSTNCTLYINDTLNETKTGFSGLNAFINFTKPFNDGDYSFIFGCTDNETSVNTTAHIFKIDRPDIDNCTLYSTIFVNFTLRDELNDTILTGDILDYFFEWSYGNYTGTYNGSEASSSYFDFCISPSWANFTTDITLQYAVTGYDERDYISDNYQADNSTDEISLYALSSGQSTEVTLHVTDDNDDDLANIFIECYRWDIPTNTDKLVESEYTDSDGNAIFNIRTGSEYYSFKFYQDGVLVLETSKFKIFSTTLEYIIGDVETTRLQEWLLMNNIVTTLGYDNATSVITFTWDDQNVVGDMFCLNVTNINNTAYHHSCSTSSASSLTYTLPVYNESFIAQGLGRYGGTEHFYVLEVLSIDKREGFRDWFGDEIALVLGFILFIFISTLALVTKNIAVVGASAALILLYFFKIIPGFSVLMGLLVLAVIVLMIINKRNE